MGDHKDNKCFKLEVPVEVVILEDLFMGGDGGEDNRDLKDEMDSQKLSKQEIIDMREEGMAGRQIVEKLIENSETFQQKTKFSQAKFLKKKSEEVSPLHHGAQALHPAAY